MESHPDRTRPEAERRRLERLRAAAARADSSSSLLEATRWLRGRLPGDDRFGDPLSTAGDAPVEQLGRHVSSLGRKRPSVAHELGLTALQVWQGLSEAQGRGRGHDETSILFCDLVEFSSWALRVGDDEALGLLRAVGDALEAAVRDRGGTIVKRLGDGLMAVFATPEEAVSAALRSVEELRGVEVAGYRPRLRFGIHHGRPRRLGGDYFGVDVNTAARVMAAAGPDEVLVSEPGCERLDRARFSFDRARPLRAPGAPEELRVCTVRRSERVA
jgi:adenylate cyclase